MPLRLVHVHDHRVYLGPTYPDTLTGDQALDLTSKYTAKLIRHYGKDRDVRVYWMSCDRATDTPHPAHIIDINSVVV